MLIIEGNPTTFSACGSNTLLVEENVWWSSRTASASLYPVTTQARISSFHRTGDCERHSSKYGYGHSLTCADHGCGMAGPPGRDDGHRSFGDESSLASAKLIIK